MTLTRPTSIETPQLDWLKPTDVAGILQLAEEKQNLRNLGILAAIGQGYARIIGSINEVIQTGQASNQKLIDFAQRGGTEMHWLIVSANQIVGQDMSAIDTTAQTPPQHMRETLQKMEQQLETYGTIHMNCTLTQFLKEVNHCYFNMISPTGFLTRKARNRMSVAMVYALAFQLTLAQCTGYVAPCPASIEWMRFYIQHMEFEIPGAKELNAQLENNPEWKKIQNAFDEPSQLEVPSNKGEQHEQEQQPATTPAKEHEPVGATA